MKQLDDILAAVARFAPILVIHALLIVWLTIRILDPATVPHGDHLWTLVSGNIDRSLQAVGLSIQRWYVLAAFAISYLTLFEWVRRVVMTVRGIRIAPLWSPKKELLAHACVAFRMEPDYWKVLEELSRRIETCSRQAEERPQPHPYQWLFDREVTLRRYYGSLVVALLAATAWAAAGAPLAVSAGRVWELALLLLAAAVAMRIAIIRDYRIQRNALGDWALREIERNAESKRPDALAYLRYERMLREVAAKKDVRRHPYAIAHRFIARLPRHWADLLRSRIAPPPWWSAERDWELIASLEMTIDDETEVPAAALLTNAFASRFTSLLECTGSGLSVLTPQELALAPAAGGGGGLYSLAQRRHGYGALTVELNARDRLDGAELLVRLAIDAPAFIVEIGCWPIERLAQFDFPEESRKLLRELALLDLPDQAWPSRDRAKPAAFRGLTLSDRAPLNIGSSYLIGSRTQLGTRASAVLQCFRAPGEKLLLAWRILHVDSSRIASPAVDPWWKPKAWKGLLSKDHPNWRRI